MSNTGKSALGGLDGNVAALIGWVIGIIAIVLIIIEKENKWVRFQAFQSVLFHVGFFVLYFALSIVVMILAQISSIFGFLALLLLPLWLIWLAGMIFGAYKAYQGADYKFPIVGAMAEKWANG
ncbi:MAG: DUF4870 domain-containing protein [Acidobacteria bacterium]|nr:DUF4870 domain-containing protein [Acidobacteriota bacterium]MCW5949596.1 DUF4870 domain-containing protein [Pyrinomonadaceae bacterium]